MTWSRHIRPITRLAIAALYAAWLGACGYDVGVNAPGQVTASTPKPDSSHAGGDSSSTGTFQRADLTVTATSTGPDSTIAAMIGLAGGRLGGAIISIQRQGSAGSLAVDTAPASGQVTFKQLVPGYYTVSILRLLSASEIARLDSANADVNGFAGGTSVHLGGSAASALVVASAGRRGSLVISEIFNAAPTDEVA